MGIVGIIFLVLCLSWEAYLGWCLGWFEKEPIYGKGDPRYKSIEELIASGEIKNYGCYEVQ